MCGESTEEESVKGIVTIRLNTLSSSTTTRLFVLEKIFCCLSVLIDFRLIEKSISGKSVRADNVIVMHLRRLDFLKIALFNYLNCTTIGQIGHRL